MKEKFIEDTVKIPSLIAVERDTLMQVWTSQKVKIYFEMLN
jgi:hypothetical protein